MQSIRDSSQQDRRVYVGNLSYDVKWHHLKDFMRQGMNGARAISRVRLIVSQPGKSSSQMYSCCRTECQR
jgi:RNA recognition motif-containing protein